MTGVDTLLHPLNQLNVEDLEEEDRKFTLSISKDRSDGLPSVNNGSVSENDWGFIPAASVIRNPSGSRKKKSLFARKMELKKSGWELNPTNDITSCSYDMGNSNEKRNEASKNSSVSADPKKEINTSPKVFKIGASIEDPEQRYKWMDSTNAEFFATLSKTHENLPLNQLEITAQNTEKLDKMSSLEIEEALEEVKSILSVKNIEYLKNRSRGKCTMAKPKISQNVVPAGNDEIGASEKNISRKSLFTLRGYIYEAKDVLRDENWHETLAFTLEELVALCRSTFTRHRKIGLTTINEIMENYILRKHEDSLKNDISSLRANSLLKLFRTTRVPVVLRMNLDDKDPNIQELCIVALNKWLMLNSTVYSLSDESITDSGLPLTENCLKEKVTLEMAEKWMNGKNVFRGYVHTGILDRLEHIIKLSNSKSLLLESLKMLRIFALHSSKGYSCKYIDGVIYSMIQDIEVDVKNTSTGNLYDVSVPFNHENEELGLCLEILKLLELA